MIRYFYKNLRSKQVSELQEYQAGAWVYVEGPSEQEIDMLVREFKLDAGHIKDALDADEMPRLEKEGDTNYIFVRYAFTTEDIEITTAPLLFVVGPNTFITISTQPLPRLQRFVNGKIDFATTQRTKLVLQIMAQIADQYENFINNVGRQIKYMRVQLKQHDINNDDFVNFVMIEDELNEFLSALLPTTAILRRLLLGRHIPLFHEDQDIVEDLLLNNEQSIEACRSNIKTVASIRDAYSTIASNNLNRSMKWLTAATVAIALPNVFFGMYGMNIDLPMQTNGGTGDLRGYFMVIGITVIVTVILLTLARRRRII
ncbi:magnesium transporter CorA family protein [Candidatus Saccharibacteria bacterium]|nr:magnesium transporter CorA family protein [Candidatus Saccharibacteria bacterium]